MSEATKRGTGDFDEVVRKANALVRPGELELAALQEWIVRSKERRARVYSRPTNLPDAVEAPFTTAYGFKALKAEADKISKAWDGTRNSTLNKSAFSVMQLVMAGHVTIADAYEALMEAATACGLGEDEADRTIQSAWAGASNKPRENVPEPNYGVTEVESLDDLTHDSDGISFWDRRPALRLIHEFCHARQVSPFAVLGCVLLRCLDSVPYNVLLPATIASPATLNSFVALVSASGGGKSSAMNVAAEVAALPYGVEPMRIVPAGTGEGIAAQFVVKTSKGETERVGYKCQVSVDEIDNLTALSNRSGATILSTLKSGWSGQTLGATNRSANSGAPVPAMSYRLTAVVGVQQSKAQTLIEDDGGGLPQRFIWLPATDASLPEPIEGEAPPECPAQLMLDWIDWDNAPLDEWYSDGERFKLLTVPPQVAFFVRHNDWQTKVGEGDPLDGHAVLARLKMAVAFAVLDGRYEMNLDDWALAGCLMLVSDNTRAKVIATLETQRRNANTARSRADAERAIYVEDSKDRNFKAKATQKVLDSLAGWGELSLRELQRKLSTKQVEYFYEVLADLEAEGRIRVENKRVALV